MSNMVDFFETFENKKCPKLLHGNASTIEEFYKIYSEQVLPKKEVIEGWDKLLNRYMEDPEAIFFVRRYSSSIKCSDNRRGFLTVFEDGFKYAFVDNFFSHYFYFMAINDFVPEYEDFKNFINTRKMPCSCIKLTSAMQKQAFPIGKITPINRNGWRVSSLFSPSDHNYTFDYRDNARRIFPRGEYDDWKIQNNLDFPIRYIKENLSNEDKNKVKAFFIRLVHPMNLLLKPSRVKNRDLSKDENFAYIDDNFDDFSDYVLLKMRDEFPTIFNSFIKTAMVDFDDSIFEPLEEIGKYPIPPKYKMLLSQNEESTIGAK